MANFWDSFLPAFQTGTELGEKAVEQGQKYGLSSGLNKMFEAKPTQVEGGGYEYLGQQFPVMPTPLMQQAAQGQYASQLYAKANQPDKAITLGGDALRQRALAIEDFSKRAVMSGDLAAVNNAYDLINDGRKSEIVQTEDGGYAVYTWPKGFPEARELEFQAPTKNALLAQLAQHINPEASLALAESEQRARMNALEYQGAEERLRGVSYDQRMDQQKMEMERWKTILKSAQDAKDPALVVQAAKKIMEIGNTVANLSANGLTGGKYDGLVYSLTGTEANSPTDWAAKNNAVGSSGREGHFGRLQFGRDRLDDFSQWYGRQVTPEEFMKTPRLQQIAEQWHFADIDNFIYSNGLDKYVGTEADGVPITMNALRAMAHIGGKANMKRFVDSGFDMSKNTKDRNNTSMWDYAKTHGGAPESMVAQGDEGVDWEALQTGLQTAYDKKDDKLNVEGWAMEAIADELEQAINAQCEAQGGCTAQERNMLATELEPIIIDRVRKRAIQYKSGGLAGTPNSSAEDPVDAALRAAGMGIGG